MRVRNPAKMGVAAEVPSATSTWSSMMITRSEKENDGDENDQFLRVGKGFEDDEDEEMNELCPTAETSG